jgi:hypothetical protein
VSFSAVAGYQRPTIRYSPGTIVENHFTTADNFRFGVIAAIPIAGNQSVRASFDQHTGVAPRTTFDPANRTFRLILLKYPFRTGELSWIFDSTDDALFPTDGTVATAGLRFTRIEDHRFREIDRVHTTTWTDNGASIARYWLMTPRQSVNARGQYYSSVDNRDHSFEIASGYSVSLVPQGRMRGDDLRLELDARSMYLLSEQRGLITTFESNLGYRNKWGVMRLGLSYVKFRGID